MTGSIGSVRRGPPATGPSRFCSGLSMVAIGCNALRIVLRAPSRLTDTHVAPADGGLASCAISAMAACRKPSAAAAAVLTAPRATVGEAGAIVVGRVGAVAGATGDARGVSAGAIVVRSRSSKPCGGVTACRFSGATWAFRNTAPRSPSRAAAPVIPGAGCGGGGTIDSAPRFMRVSAPSAAGRTCRPCRTPSEPKGRAMRHHTGASAPVAIGLPASCAATVVVPVRTRAWSGALTCRNASPATAEKWRV